MIVKYQEKLISVSGQVNASPNVLCLVRTCGRLLLQISLDAADRLALQILFCA